jgi:predicted nucleic acid-binding protein
VSTVVYVDTSAVLRAVLERGLSPELERQLGEARYLMTSRLALVEAARAFLRLRLDGVAEAVLSDARREVDSLWARCAIWELTAGVCELASLVAPHQALRTLDALHLATYLTARQKLGPEITLLTADERLQAAARAVLSAATHLRNEAGPLPCVTTLCARAPVRGGCRAARAYPRRRAGRSA